ncbi:MAG TPA: hypothetical protein DDW65_13700 [Firmicutes bacterium]|jgi:hypothetical protein|nr:hypothetical protein [Bacillota bacterium]
MYIVGLNSKQRFYFISRAEQREKLEEKGILILNATYDRITAAADVVRELNNKAERERRTSIISKVG